MTPRQPPKAPAWAVWAMSRMMPERDVRIVLDELAELHAHWVESRGVAQADRLYRRQVRQYPLRLLVNGMVSLGRSGPWWSPRTALVGVRSLARAPGITSAIVLTVGIGIGGCTALFAVIDVLFLRPLPYPDADELVRIYTESPPRKFPFSVADLQALEDQQTSFEAVAAYRQRSRTLVTSDRADRVTAVDASPKLFELLGVPLLSGRTPGDVDGLPGAEPTTLVTQGFAARRLGSVRADGSDALGAAVELDGEDHSVIGIVPASFGPLGGDAEVFTTLRLEEPTRKGPFFLQVFGRLRDGVEPETAAAELRAINQRIFPVWADSYQDDRASWGLEGLAETLRADSGRLLGILMGAVALLLLVAVANAANLLLARVSARRRELVVRRALGASRAQVAGHLLTETMLLAIGGVVVGLVIAAGVVSILPTVAGGYIPRLAEVRLGGATLAFALSLAAGCGVLFGVVPMIQGVGGSEIGSGLRAGSRGSTQTVRQQRAQRLLVGGQLAVVVPLLTGAGLLLGSFAKLQAVDPGFTPEALVTMRLAPSPAAFPDPETRGQFWTSLLERVTALPEVELAGVASARPPEEPVIINNFDLEDRPTPPGESEPAVPWIYAEPGFFESLDIRLVAGRMFEEGDRAYEPEVAIVDAAWAERFFPGEDAVGRRFRHGGCSHCDWTTVIGVVEEVPYEGLAGSGGGSVYQPDPLRYWATPFLFLRTRGDAAQVVARVREEVARIDRATPVTEVETGASLMEASLARPRHLMLVLGAFSAVALLLAVVGLYGVTAYSVEQRRGEIAVRLALGGSPGAVVRRVVSQGLALTLVGLLVGTGVALGLTQVLSMLLFEVSPRDPRIMMSVAALMLVVSTVACLVPARRVAGMDPARTLREE